MWHILESSSPFKGFGSLNGDGGHDDDDGTPSPRMAMCQGKTKGKMVKWANIRAKNNNQINGDRAAFMKARAKAFGG